MNFFIESFKFAISMISWVIQFFVICFALLILYWLPKWMHGTRMIADDMGISAGTPNVYVYVIGAVASVIAILVFAKFMQRVFIADFCDIAKRFTYLGFFIVIILPILYAVATANDGVARPWNGTMFGENSGITIMDEKPKVEDVKADDGVVHDLMGNVVEKK